MREDMPDRMLEDMRDRMSDDMPDRMLEDTLENEDMRERMFWMLQDVPERIRIYAR